MNASTRIAAAAENLRGWVPECQALTNCAGGLGCSGVPLFENRPQMGSLSEILPLAPPSISARQLASNVRRLSSRFSGIRADGPNNWDLSFIKNTRLAEGVQLQFRAEAINAMNHPQFTAPNTNPATTAFGVVTGEFAWPRVVQFGMKVLF